MAMVYQSPLIVSLKMSEQDRKPCFERVRQRLSCIFVYVSVCVNSDGSDIGVCDVPISDREGL